MQRARMQRARMLRTMSRSLSLSFYDKKLKNLTKLTLHFMPQTAQVGSVRIVAGQPWSK